VAKIEQVVEVWQDR